MNCTAANIVCVLLVAFASAAPATESRTVSGTTDPFKKGHGITEPRFREFYDAAHLSSVRYSEQGSPAYLLGFMAQADSDDEMANVAMGFFEKNRDVFRLRDPQTELRLASREIDREARHRLRFQQLCQGIEVQGGHYTAIFSPGGTLETVSGNFYPNVTASGKPQISSLVAPLLILDKVSEDAVTVTGIDVKQIIVPEKRNSRLAWRIILHINGDGLAEYVVDAVTGQLLSAPGNHSARH
jgi:Zn-dependent metalloprotease